mgnify:CR=1 FL=1
MDLKEPNFTKKRKVEKAPEKREVEVAQAGETHRNVEERRKAAKQRHKENQKQILAWHKQRQISGEIPLSESRLHPLGIDASNAPRNPEEVLLLKKAKRKLNKEVKKTRLREAKEQKVKDRLAIYALQDKFLPKEGESEEDMGGKEEYQLAAEEMERNHSQTGIIRNGMEVLKKRKREGTVTPEVGSEVRPVANRDRTMIIPHNFYNQNNDDYPLDGYRGDDSESYNNESIAEGEPPRDGSIENNSSNSLQGILHRYKTLPRQREGSSSGVKRSILDEEEEEEEQVPPYRYDPTRFDPYYRNSYNSHTHQYDEKSDSDGESIDNPEPRYYDPRVWRKPKKKKNLEYSDESEYEDDEYESYNSPRKKFKSDKNVKYPDLNKEHPTANDYLKFEIEVRQLVAKYGPFPAILFTSDALQVKTKALMDREGIIVNKPLVEWRVKRSLEHLKRCFEFKDMDTAEAALNALESFTYKGKFDFYDFKEWLGKAKIIFSLFKGLIKRKVIPESHINVRILEKIISPNEIAVAFRGKKDSEGVEIKEFTMEEMWKEIETVAKEHEKHSVAQSDYTDTYKVLDRSVERKSEQEVNDAPKKDVSFAAQEWHNNQGRYHNNNGGNQGYNNNNKFPPGYISPNYKGTNPNTGMFNNSNGFMQEPRNGSGNYPKSTPQGQPKPKYQPSSKPRVDKGSKTDDGKKYILCYGCYHEYPPELNHLKGSCPFGRMKGFGNPQRTPLVLSEAQKRIGSKPRKK